VELVKNIFGSRMGGLIHTINPHLGDRIDPLNGRSILLAGKEKITEKINGLSFFISMESFFQTNPLCAEKLYNKVRNYAGSQDKDDGQLVLDLFCGTGTIAQLLVTAGGRKVIGVDIVEKAIEDAKENANVNGLTNVEFIAADVGKFLSMFPQYQGNIGCVVLDPPRSGISPSTLRKVLNLGAKRVVYVSCNPATQARDTEIMMQAGYELMKLSLADQFPHTAHVETIALFEKN
jgi:23S rRNA (uracil-5-)-methyltransferase RumA